MHAGSCLNQTEGAHKSILESDLISVFCSSYIRKQVLHKGATGMKVAFDDNGDRINAEYDIVNVQAPGNHSSVGIYTYDEVYFL